jgi:hypothetical protein
MNELFIIIIILIVLWFINEHTKKVEGFESNGEKIELSLCDLVTLFKKTIVREINDSRSLMMQEQAQQQLIADLEPVIDQKQVQPLVGELEQVIQKQVQPLVGELENASIESKNINMSMNANMNIINNVEPHDSEDLYTNHSLLETV